MVLPHPPLVGYSPSSRTPAQSSPCWAPPLARPNSATSSSLTSRKPTPIPPKRSFADPRSATSTSHSSPSNQPPSPFSLSPLLLGSRLVDTPESAVQRLQVPSSTPALMESPSSSPLLSVRNCLPLPAASSPLPGGRQLPVAPPSSPNVSMMDKLAHSAAFKQLCQQRTTADKRKEEAQLDEPSAEQPSGVVEVVAEVKVYSTDEKHHSLSSTGSGRGIDCMPVLVE